MYKGEQLGTNESSKRQYEKPYSPLFVQDIAYNTTYQNEKRDIEVWYRQEKREICAITSGKLHSLQNELKEHHYEHLLKHTIENLESSIEKIAQNQNPSQQERLRYSFKNISLKLLKKIEEEYHAGIHPEKFIDHIAPGRDMIKIIAEIDTLISSGESISIKETLLFIPRLLNAARGFGDTGIHAVAEIIKCLNHSFLYAPSFHSSEALGKKKSPLGDTLTGISHLPESILSGAVDAVADTLGVVGTLLLKPEEVLEFLVSELPHLVGEFTHLVKADGGIIEFCKKRGIQYGKYIRDNPGEGIPNSTYILSYIGFLVFFGNKLSHKKILPPNLIDTIAENLGKGIATVRYLPKARKINKQQKTIETVKNKQREVEKITSHQKEKIQNFQNESFLVRELNESNSQVSVLKNKMLEINHKMSVLGENIANEKPINTEFLRTKILTQQDILKNEDFVSGYEKIIQFSQKSHSGTPIEKLNHSHFDMGYYSDYVKTSELFRDMYTFLFNAMGKETNISHQKQYTLLFKQQFKALQGSYKKEKESLVRFKKYIQKNKKFISLSPTQYNTIESYLTGQLELQKKTFEIYSQEGQQLLTKFMDYVQRHNEILNHYNTLENQYSRAIENSLLAKKKLNTYQNASLDMYPTVLDINKENIQTFHKTPGTVKLLENPQFIALQKEQEEISTLLTQKINQILKSQQKIDSFNKELGLNLGNNFEDISKATKLLTQKNITAHSHLNRDYLELFQMQDKYFDIQRREIKFYLDFLQKELLQMQQDYMVQSEHLTHNVHHLTEKIGKGAEVTRENLERTEKSAHKLESLGKQTGLFSYLSGLKLENYLTGKYEQKDLNLLNQLENFTHEALSHEFENIISENITDEKRIKQLIYLQIERMIGYNKDIEENINLQRLKDVLFNPHAKATSLEFALAQSITNATHEYLKKKNEGIDLNENGEYKSFTDKILVEAGGFEVKEKREIETKQGEGQGKEKKKTY